jgi:aspartokinase
MLIDIDIKLFKNERVVLFTLQEVSDKIGIISDIFDLIKERGINLLLVDTMPLPGGKIGFNFLVQDSEKQEMQQLLEEIAEIHETRYLKEFGNVALITFLAEKLARKKGIMAEIFNLLAFYGIKIFLLSTSLHSFSIIISREKTDLALNILRENLNISKEDMI